MGYGLLQTLRALKRQICLCLLHCSLVFILWLTVIFFNLCIMFFLQYFLNTMLYTVDVLFIILFSDLFFNLVPDRHIFMCVCVCVLNYFYLFIKVIFKYYFKTLVFAFPPFRFYIFVFYILYNVLKTFLHVVFCYNTLTFEVF